MPANSSSAIAAITARSTQAIPCLRYTNARAAIDWLVAVLGADARQVHDGPDGNVMHAELWFGSACVMLGSAKPDDRMPSATGQSMVYIVADSTASVDAIHDSAVAAGARVTIPIHDTDYGSHEFGCLDPEGNFWDFGSYAPA